GVPPGRGPAGALGAAGAEAEAEAGQAPDAAAPRRQASPGLGDGGHAPKGRNPRLVGAPKIQWVVRGWAVDESEWLRWTNPKPMLDSLRGKASDRKLGLFFVACCRRVC